MARALTSLLLAGVCASASAQAFGRFGYNESWDLPGLTVDKNGFRAKHPAADYIGFGHPKPRWTPLETSQIGQGVSLGDYVRAPSKLRAELTAPGFSAYFPMGMSLEVRSTGAPYITWAEGSVGEEVPTPPLRWAVLSFRTAQPPILLSFFGEQPSLQVSGAAGAWKLQTREDFQGWVRVLLPIGTTAVAANSAATLGDLAARAAAEEAQWTSAPARLVDGKLEADESSVTATYVFDRPGAVVPQGALLAPLGGYPIRVLSKSRRIEAPTEAGPLSVLEGTELRIRFPVARLSPEKFVSVGELSMSVGEDKLQTDPTAVASLAFEALSSAASTPKQSLARSALEGFLTSAAYALEPWTGQQHTYDGTGSGLAMTAAQALLDQVLDGHAGAPRPLLSSVLWRLDWHTWTLLSPDRDGARRAATFAAVAALLSGQPELRLQAALLQAGLSAERGLAIWHRTRAKGPAPLLLEPLEGLRKALFELDSPAGVHPLAAALMSHIRVRSDRPVRALTRNGKTFLSWMSLDGKPGMMILVSEFELKLGPAVNLREAQAARTPGSTLLRYVPKDVGACEIELILPPLAPALPTLGALSYVEAVR